MSLRDSIATNKFLSTVWQKGADFVAGIHWPRTAAVFNKGVYYSLTEADHDKIRKLLKDNYLIILTRRRSHLTTYLIALISWLKTRTKSHYTHALMNVEGDLDDALGTKLIEATGEGVHYSTFMQVFDCDSVCFLKPKEIPLEQWTLVLDAVKKEFGYPYDTLFDLQDDAKVSCVEMVYQGIKKLPDWEHHFAELAGLIERSGHELTPQMLYDCGDLELVLEIRR